MKTILFIILSFILLVQAQNECATKVTELRRVYQSSSRMERVKLATKVTTEIRAKHPEARTSTVVYFLSKLFDGSFEPEKTCKLYDELFKNKEDEKNRFIDCLKKCLTWQAVFFLK
jgi:hypothetical protein